MRDKHSGQRPVRVLTRRGLEFVEGLSRQESTVVGQHWNAVRRYLESGEDRGLTRFDGVRVGGYQLETDIDAIEWHAVRGDVSFESIYDEVV